MQPRDPSQPVRLVPLTTEITPRMFTVRGLARKATDPEKRSDGQFEQVFEALRALLASPEPEQRPKIGFNHSD